MPAIRLLKGQKKRIRGREEKRREEKRREEKRREEERREEIGRASCRERVYLEV